MKDAFIVFILLLWASVILPILFNVGMFLFGVVCTWGWEKRPDVRQARWDQRVSLEKEALTLGVFKDREDMGREWGSFFSKQKSRNRRLNSDEMEALWVNEIAKRVNFADKLITNRQAQGKDDCGLASPASDDVPTKS